MRAYAIVIDGNEISERGYSILASSSFKVGNEFSLERFHAVTPTNVMQLLEEQEVKWNYPWEGEVIDFTTGLKKKSYPTHNRAKRVACSMSHYMLWKKCLETNENILILEHDAVFTHKVDFDIDDTRYKILGINNPLMATRKAREFHDTIKNSSEMFMKAPYIDPDKMIPQGLAGNSAYIITPPAAEELIDAVKNPKIGLWPNDALMCNQLFYFLGVTKKFYTKVQGLPSTTTL